MQEKYVRDSIKDTSESSTGESCWSAAVFVCDAQMQQIPTNRQMYARKLAGVGVRAKAATAWCRCGVRAAARDTSSGRRLGRASCRAEGTRAGVYAWPESSRPARSSACAVCCSVVECA